MRKYIVIGLIVFIALLVSIMLIPGGSEIALMQLKDKRYEEARRAYQKQLEQGDDKYSTVLALTDLHLQYAEIDRAIVVLEGFVAKNPTHVHARKELGKLYQFAQRPDDYLSNLEEINRLEQDDDNLKTMAEMYGVTQQYEKQEPVLQTLDEQRELKEPQDYTYLANLQASQGKKDEAVSTLTQLEKTFPQNFGFDQLQLMVTMQLEQGKPDEAYTSAQQWLVRQQQTNADNIARLVNILHYRGSPELAWKLMKPYEQRAIEYTPIAVELAYLYVALGKTDEAYNLLIQLEQQDKLPRSLYRDYAVLAVANDDIEKAIALIEKIQPSQITEGEGISFIEVAIDRDEPRITDLIESKYRAEGLSHYPRVDAALAVAKRQSSADAKLETVLDSEMTVSERLQFARLCILRAKKQCAADFLNRVPREGLTTSEAIQLATIYLDAGRSGEASELVVPRYVENTGNQQLADLRVKIAAAESDTHFIEQWTEMNQPVDAKKLRDLYFVAQDYRAYDTTMQLAKKYYEAEQSDESRSFMINAYLAAKNYEAALPYLRELKTYSQQDRDDYLAVLTALSKQSPQYNAELAEFAASELRGNVPERQKQALIYTLINAGRADMALPYIREFAVSKGGEWVEIYASNLDKVGRHDEARDFRMQLALDESIPVKTRRQIAFALLEKGYKDDALTVFADLATNASAKSPDVAQLLYLWGPRLSQDQLDWLSYRAISATSPTEQGEWIRYISNYADAETLVSFVDENPQLLASPGLLETYLDAMHRLGRFKELESQMVVLSAETQNPTLLRTYAKMARGYDMPEVATSAYRRLNELKGGDPEAQRNIGVVAFTQADYSETMDTLQDYAQYREDNGRYHPEDYQAYFYLAQTYKRDKEPQQAAKYFNKVLELTENPMPTNQLTDIDSKRAQALVALGRKDEGYALFEEAMTRYPDDALLRADFISTLVEEKEYARAEKLADEANLDAHRFTTTAQLHENLEPVRLNASALKGYRTYSNGNELLLEFNGELADKALDETALRNYPWLSYSTQGYDRALISAKPEYKLTLQPLSDNYVIVPERMPSNDEARFKEDLALRYEMLKARIDLETGEHYEAVKRLNSVVPSHTNNATLLGYTANAENYIGRWKRALRMLDQAQAAMPENEDIAELRRDIWLRRGQFVRLDYEWFRLGSSDQRITTLDGLAFIDEELEIGFRAQHNDIHGSNVRRIDGRLGDFEEEKQRGEIFLASEDDEGNRIHGAIYGNNDTVGAGAYYQWYHEYGMSRVTAEYHRPNWLFVEAVLDDATRDRLAYAHELRINPLWQVAGEVGLNRYNVKGENGVADSVTVQGSVTRQLMQSDPYLALNYALDAEYRKDEKVFTDLSGERFVPLLDSREVHTMSIVADYEFDRDTDLLLQGGYSYERLSGANGPLISGILTRQEFDDAIELQLRASYGAFTSDNVGDSSRVGGYVKWRF